MGFRWNWLPWRFLVRRAARAHGFLDPLALLARLQRFAQPSEVAEPIELLRAGVVFHARGLINARVIQHNLDWVWPYWAERQFDPSDPSFLPRAFSITHVNLTHRNWTAVGLPEEPALPVVDPRGLATPFHDGWSLDGWVRSPDGDTLYPSRETAVSQRLDLEGGLAVETVAHREALSLEQRAWVEYASGMPTLRLRYRAAGPAGTRLLLAVRPYNPEGVSFVHRIRLDAERRSWQVDGQGPVRFSEPADEHSVSDYRRGDVATHGDAGDGSAEGCEVGMATAAAGFELDATGSRELTLSVPLAEQPAVAPGPDWPAALAGLPSLALPDRRLRFLHDAAVRTLLLHSVEDVYPGPYTYRRFWFRDAAFIIHALLALGLDDRARRALDRFPARQNAATGYFRSQEGEWDSNGQVLWIWQRYAELTGRELPPAWQRCLHRAARWIQRKRLPGDADSPAAGLLPAGFSAEHLGPNDYYYWDDFWALAGLEAAAALTEAQEPERAAHYRQQAASLREAIDRSLERAASRLGRPAMPAAPQRRMDPGAVGSLAAGYPLQLVGPRDRRLLGTVEHLLEHSLFEGGFFQDMIHSGVNAYLTLHLAQVLLRAGDTRALALVERVARLASPTGQWPEAIHPRTGGGCMGDGQHVWAAAEWVLMVRALFLREEGDRLVLLPGVERRWLEGDAAVAYGPVPTRFGSISLRAGPADADGGIPVQWEARWRQPPRELQVALPGHPVVSVDAEAGAARIPPEGSA